MDRGYRTRPEFGRPTSVTAAGVLLSIAGVLVVLNILLLLVGGQIPLLPLVFAIGLTVVLFRGAGSTFSGSSRSWGLGGGWTLIGMAMAVVISVPTQLEGLPYGSSKDHLATALVLLAALYCAAGATVLALLYQPAALRHFSL